MNEPSRESEQLARSLVEGSQFDMRGMGASQEQRQEEFILKLAHALDASWKRGFEDSQTADRLKRMGLVR